MTLKRCSRCKCLLHKDAYYKSSTKNDGLQSTCIKCHKKRKFRQNYKSNHTKGNAKKMYDALYLTQGLSLEDLQYKLRNTKIQKKHFKTYLGRLVRAGVVVCRCDKYYRTELGEKLR